MNIQRNSQLWRFCDRYCSSVWSWRFEEGQGDVCALVRGILVATLKCAGLTLLAFVALQMLTTPFLTLYLVGSPINPGGPDSWISFVGFLGTVIYTLAIGALIWNFVWLPLWDKIVRSVRKRKAAVNPDKQPSLVVEYIKNVHGKYCTRVTVT